MPQALGSGDRKLLIGAGAVLALTVVIGALLSPVQVTGSSVIPSSYSPAWSGAKAAFLMLQDLGYDVQRWESPPESFVGDPRQYVLILADPTEQPSEDDKAAIRNFLQRGGRVLAAGSAAARFFPDAEPFAEGSPLVDPAKFNPAIPSPIVRGAPEISMAAPLSWQPSDPGQLIVYGNEQTAAVIAYPVGSGEVIWWGASTPLTNGGIRQSDNLQFFLNSVGPRSRRILWDEYFHGVHGSLFSFFARTSLVWGLVQLGLLFLAIVVTYSRRLGPILISPSPSRLSPLEFVETLGNLYQSAHAGSAAVAIAVQQLRTQLTRRFGLPANATAAELAAIASRNLGWNEAELRETLEKSDRASQTKNLKDEDALPLVQQLFEYSRRLRTGRSDPEERRVA